MGVPFLSSEACNYLFVYEYVVDIQLKTDTWGAIKRGVATKSLNVDEDEGDDEDNSSKKKKKKNVNRTLLLGGRKDGYICVFNWDTGDVEFKIDVSSLSYKFVGLTLSQTTNFRLFQTEGVCRRQF